MKVYITYKHTNYTLVVDLDFYSMKVDLDFYSMKVFLSDKDVTNDFSDSELDYLWGQHIKL